MQAVPLLRLIGDLQAGGALYVARFDLGDG
jgi:hypothetical protein